MPSPSEVPAFVREGQRLGKLADRLGELSIDLVKTREPGERQRIANDLRALADQVERA